MNRELVEPLVLEAPSLVASETAWHTTWFSTGFGQRLPRESLCISGRLPVGEHLLHCFLPLLHLAPQACRASG
jgi:hypothetical protein